MNKIGFFGSSDTEENISAIENPEAPVNTTPRKSIVNVRFPENGKTLAYYNDKFELQPGDLVYVEGKFEGKQGRVVSVNYSFKIKLSDYKRVTALVDTEVHGKLYSVGTHFVAFDPSVIPQEKIRGWFLCPAEDEEYVTGEDENGFPLDNLAEMGITPEIASRGGNYYEENRVRYICVNGNSGYAIVEGSKPYEVEFNLENGFISNLVCSCMCNYNCKHEFAAMLQLKETLGQIEEHYPEMLRHDGSDYFAVIFKDTLIHYAIAGRKTGILTL